MAKKRVQASAKAKANAAPATANAAVPPLSVLFPVAAEAAPAAAEPRRRPSKGPVKKKIPPPAVEPAPVRIQLDARPSKVMDGDVATLSGRTLGPNVEKLVAYANDLPGEIRLDGRSFRVIAPLRPGRNEITVVAVDVQGRVTWESVMVEHTPRTEAGGIVITSPRDGATLGTEDLPVVFVEGEVDDLRISTVWLAANERRTAVPVQAGRFRHLLPLTQPTMRLRAEAPVNGGTVRQSGTVTVQAAAMGVSAGLLTLSWPEGQSGVPVEVLATRRGSPERLDGIDEAVPLKARPDLFYVRDLKPGVYTFVLRYHADGATTRVTPTLYLPQAGALAARPLKPVSLTGTGSAVLAKVLVPHGIFWQQDEWFTGKTESVDTVTKFRWPEGISWVERKVDLQ